MPEQITLNDGTTIAGNCIQDERNLFVYLYGRTVIEGVMLFSDPERIATLTVSSYGHTHVYNGYTEIYSASHEYGNCNLVMRKAEANA